jgi:hypothetical protein
MSSLRLLKGLLWFVTIYQFVMGFLLLMPPAAAQLVVSWYGASVDWTPQFTFILKPLGAYMIMTGLIAAAAARADVPHPAITSSLAVLFGINALYRILRFEYVRTTFGISSAHLTLQIVVLLGLAGALMFLYRAAARDTGAQPLASPQGSRA